MLAKNCLLCGRKTKEHIADPGKLLLDETVDCDVCGYFVVEEDLARNFIAFEDKKHLLSGYTRELWETSPKQVSPILRLQEISSIISQCPQTVKEKADKLLHAIHQKTSYFGEVIPIDFEIDYPLAYAKNKPEFYATINYLIELDLIRHPKEIVPGLGPNIPIERKVFLTGKGIDAIESRFLSPPITVFISSTCYDLMDVRAELADILSSKGFIPKISDDPFQFDISPTEDSIQSCIRNVDEADVVICILDKRYGPVLPPDNKYSATHTEILRAWEIGKPVYFFGRDKALSDYDQLRVNEDAPVKWVEDKQKKNWVNFVNEIHNLASAVKDGRSNWIDTFHNSIDLKKLAIKRLSEYQRK